MFRWNRPGDHPKERRVPPIHIIVRASDVTLTGAVASNLERQVAETIVRSTFGVLSVNNELRIAS